MRSADADPGITEQLSGNGFSSFRRMHAFIRLPKYFKSKLNLTGRRLRRGDQSGVADRTPRRIKDISIVEWWSEIRVVENIEEFRSKLHIEGVGNSFDMIVLEY